LFQKLTEFSEVFDVAFMKLLTLANIVRVVMGDWFGSVSVFVDLWGPNFFEIGGVTNNVFCGADDVILGKNFATECMWSGARATDNRHFCKGMCVSM
jgi:hypothetical protein